MARLTDGQDIEAAGEGVKYDAGKVRLGFIHPVFLFAIADIMTLGAKKYSAWNWFKGMPWSQPYDALGRHLGAWWGRREPDGSLCEDGLDPDTKRSHLWHAACCIMFLVVYEVLGLGEDDRPPLLGGAGPDATKGRTEVSGLSTLRGLGR